MSSKDSNFCILWLILDIKFMSYVDSNDKWEVKCRCTRVRYVRYYIERIPFGINISTVERLTCKRMENIQLISLFWISFFQTTHSENLLKIQIRKKNMSFSDVIRIPRATSKMCTFDDSFICEQLTILGSLIVFI